MSENPGSIMLEPLIIDNEIHGALLVAWRKDGEPFDVHDEEAMHDFSVIFASSRKLLNTVGNFISSPFAQAVRQCLCDCSRCRAIMLQRTLLPPSNSN